MGDDSETMREALSTQLHLRVHCGAASLTLYYDPNMLIFSCTVQCGRKQLGTKGDKGHCCRCDQLYL